MQFLSKTQAQIWESAFIDLFDTLKSEFLPHVKSSVVNFRLTSLMVWKDLFVDSYLFATENGYFVDS